MKTLVLALFLMLIMALPVAAFTSYGSTYRIDGDVVTGTNLSNNTLPNNYSLFIAVGQPIVGTVNTSKYELCLGLYCFALPFTYYEFNLAGDLAYGNNTMIKNANVNIRIENNSYVKSVDTTTNSNGHFYATIKNIPKSVATQNFKIITTVYGDISAFYECTYNVTSGKCEYY